MITTNTTIVDNTDKLIQILLDMETEVVKLMPVTKADTLKSMVLPKSGRIYKRPDGTPYVASAPFEAIANYSFETYRTLAMKAWKTQFGSAWSLWSNTPQAFFTEYGTKKMAPRQTFYKQAVRVDRKIRAITIRTKQKIAGLR